MKNKVHIAIDAGATTGIAIWDGSYLKLDSGRFWDIVYWIEKYIYDDLKPSQTEFIIYVENPNLNKITFRRRGNMRIDDRKAQNVGMNKRDAQLWVEWCECNNLPHQSVKPLRKKKNGVNIWKGNDGKISHEEFVTLTKYSKQTNQHERDACLVLMKFVKL
jgi:tRNA/tmRNA/rRNA uracil-C5-methylase (TrmA/RlmC/RlmD family)